MNRRLLLLLPMGVLGLLAQVGCADKPPPPPVLTLTIQGGAEQNPDASGKAAPVAVRMYQLSGTGKFEQADGFALIYNEAKTLGTDEAAGSQEFLIAPGDKKTVTVDLKPMVSAIGVAVLYRNIDTAKWRADAPAAAHGPTNLTATIGKATLTLK